MDFRAKTEASPEAKKHDLSFIKESRRPETVSYVFKNVVVTIDSSGKNYKALPELIFGTFDNEPNAHTLDKPETKREGVDMEYVLKCIQEVVKDSGINKFWVYPFGDDKPEDKIQREQARARLFSRYMNLVPAENDFGYIVDL